MHYHHFALGQVVRLMTRAGTSADRVAKYKVTRLLPSDGVQFRYCLEHEEYLFSRLAWEIDLIGVISARAPGVLMGSPMEP
jgi:hypothetical protein